jgi:4-hydroxy-tetrahydrodipicolinate synthase
MKKNIPVSFCMSVTPFTVNGTLDETGLRAHLRRIVDAGCGVYLGSPGAGEGHALSANELKRLYEIGVEECKGRVLTYANPPEQRTSEGVIAACNIAVQAGIEVIEVYQLDGGHNLRPTEQEQEHYYRDIFEAIDHPIALSVHAFSGYLAPVRLIQKLCSEYRQIVAAHLVSIPAIYWIEMREALGPRITLYASSRDALQYLPLGAQGYQSADANLVPCLSRAIGEHFVNGRIERSASAYTDFIKFTKVLKESTPRTIKMAMKALNLPGGTGVLRKPYFAAPGAELEKMARELDEFGISKIELAARESLKQ